MKKFLTFALAAAFAVALAVPALAGDISVTGRYLLEGMKLDVKAATADTSGISKGSDAWYEPEMDLIVKVTQGAVTANVNFELIDLNRNEAAGKGKTRHNGLSTFTDIVDSYDITWKVDDKLSFKTGQFPINFGRNIALYDQGGYNIGVGYALDAVDLGFAIGKVAEGRFVEASGNTKDADADEVVLSANFKKAGPFTKLNALLIYGMAEKGAVAGTSHNMTFVGVDFAIPAGPVALAGELGFFSGDDILSRGDGKAEGNYIELEADLSKLVGSFNLGVGLLRSSDKMYTGLQEYFNPLLILLNADALNAGNNNKTAIWVTAGYNINDKLTVGAAILPYANATKVSSGSKKIGTEYDLTATYKFADNVTYMAGYASASLGDLGKTLAWSGDGSGAGNAANRVYPIQDKTITRYYNKLTFAF